MLVGVTMTKGDEIVDAHMEGDMQRDTLVASINDAIYRGKLDAYMRIADAVRCHYGINILPETRHLIKREV
jgi:hypothetical protein